jgi:phosphopantothenate---cysteine ligase (CTP)
MRIFVTAGNTQTPIDRVRCITNVFTGRTGACIALEAYCRGHTVTLATSHPEVILDKSLAQARWQCQTYRTFADLDALMARHIAAENYDAVIHCAAINDYECAGIYAPGEGTQFDASSQTWTGAGKMLDRAASKVKSDEPELWLRLVRAPKLADKIRTDWKFRGILVKFKLESGISDPDLLARAEQSRRQSQADWMVANTLEGAGEWAFIGRENQYRRVARADLAAELIDALEGKAP